MNSSSSILAGFTNEVAWFRVEGKGSLENCLTLKKSAYDSIDQGKHALVVDLEACTYMDSSFAGTLSGIAQKLSEVGSKLVVVRPTQKAETVLTNLGLNRKITLEATITNWKKVWQAVADCLEEVRPNLKERKKQQEAALEAHLRLASLNSENKQRFGDVIRYLRSDKGD